MQSIHDNFNIFQNVEKVLGQKTLFISEVTPDREKYLKWLLFGPLKQICTQCFITFDMTSEVITSKKIKLIIIFEHKPQYSFWLYIACSFKNVPCFFFVHGMQQARNKSLFHKIGFKLLLFLEHKFNFWPIHIELSDKILEPSSRFKKSLVIPHPLPRIPIFKSHKFNPLKVRIGIVGILRGDKPIMPLIDYLQKLVSKHPNYELIVGTPLWQLSDELRASSVTVVDTGTAEQYTDLLKTIDIIVNTFDEKSFYFRPSGIINDALTAGCYVIAPDFPVFKAQVSTPVKVGGLYDSFDQIEELIENGINELNSNSVDFENWRECRGNELLINNLARQIAEVVSKS